VSPDTPVVAAFDFDGTLTIRDCVVPFLDRVAGRVGLVAGILKQPLALAGAVVHRDRDRMKAVAVRAAFTGREADAVSAIGTEFAATVAGSWLRADTTARLAWHRQQGHHIVLVSASLGAYLHAVGKILGVDAVLCTEAIVGPDGRYTGEMAGGNCRGPEKIRRLESWMGEIRISEAEVWAYGDSRGDRELLAAARHPFFVKDLEIEPAPQGVS
jgi:phosphatidylglycerophosphatase C